MSHEQHNPVYPTEDTSANLTPLPPSGASTPSGGPITRTVAIIKNHGLDHRFDIESLISEAKFEIVKERQMEFDTDTDPETLYELFGEDARSFSEGPVWVYILERRRAIETWQELMGPADPAEAHETAPHSIRARYGISTAQNTIMGSPDAAAAEVQIASLFASSPPFPTSELPEEDVVPGYQYGSMRSVSSSVLSTLKRQLSSTGSQSSSKFSSDKQKIRFSARALPATHAKPDIAPRMTKAAALRQGIKLERTDSNKSIPTKDEMKQIFMDVPGHRRSSTISVASTAPPAFAPRMTKAAALRLGIKQEKPVAPVKSRQSMEKRPTFEGVPGHKRRETISVASSAAPVVTPRTNRSAALRATMDKAPPSSFMFRGPSSGGLSRSSSSTSLNSNYSNKPPSRPPSAANNYSRPPSAANTYGRPPSAAAAAPTRPAPRPSVSRSASLSRATAASAARPPLANATLEKSVNGGAKPANGGTAPPKLQRRPSSISAPTIAPRTNKSAALRAEKKAKEEAEAAAKAAKMKPRKPGFILSG